MKPMVQSDFHLGSSTSSDSDGDEDESSVASSSPSQDEEDEAKRNGNDDGDDDDRDRPVGLKIERYEKSAPIQLPSDVRDAIEKEGTRGDGKDLFDFLSALPARFYEVVHRFNEAVLMFSLTLKHDYEEQLEKQRKTTKKPSAPTTAGKPETHRKKGHQKGHAAAAVKPAEQDVPPAVAEPLHRFSWRNDGPISEDFAIACDQAKALYAALPKKEFQDKIPFSSVFCERWFASHLASQCPWMPEGLVFLGTQQHKSKICVKMKDWTNGGTRYSGGGKSTSGVHANTLFAAEDVRLAKLLEWIENRNVAIKCHSKRERIGADKSRLPLAEKPTKKERKKERQERRRLKEEKSSVIPDAEHGEWMPLVLGPLPYKQPHDYVKKTPVPIGGRARPAPLLAVNLLQIADSSSVTLSRSDIPLPCADFAALCAKLTFNADPYAQLVLLQSFVSRASPDEHQRFESNGGVRSVCDWVMAAQWTANDTAVAAFLESLLLLDGVEWSDETREYWLL